MCLKNIFKKNDLKTANYDIKPMIKIHKTHTLSTLKKLKKRIIILLIGLEITTLYVLFITMAKF